MPDLVSTAFNHALVAQGEDYYRALESLVAALKANATPGFETIETPPEPVSYFGDGVYGRELTIEAGQIVVSRIHKHAGINVILEGAVTVANGDGDPVLFEAPCVFESPAGAQRLLYTHTRVRWVCFHAHPEAQSRDVKRMEKDLACYSRDELDISLKTIEVTA